MSRKALLKVGDDFVVLEESKFEAETQLQEALKLNPDVIPVSDLDLAEVGVVCQGPPPSPACAGLTRPSHYLQLAFPVPGQPRTSPTGMHFTGSPYPKQC